MDFETYQSPFSWRYGSSELRHIWSETRKRQTWREIWLALAELQMEYGLVSPEQVADLRAHVAEVDIPRALEIENQIQHDLMAEIQVYAEQCPVGGGIIHLGMTSMDVVDNTDVIRVSSSLALIIAKLADLLDQFCTQIERWADFPTMAFTHLQPAEPTTLGYRFSIYAQDLYEDWRQLVGLRKRLRLKGLKGAVGTRASFAAVIGLDQVDEFDRKFGEKFGLPVHQITTQVYSRKQDYALAAALAGIGATLNKFAFDLRFLQTPLIGELAEPFGARQVGSSAMPFKKNPIQAEKINSLARLLAQHPRLAWDNAANSSLERTLDDSANRRTALPEAFLITDEIITTATRIVAGMDVNQPAIERNLAAFAPFAATEGLLMELVRAGADRQAMHERLRNYAMQVWDDIQQGEQNKLADILVNDAVFMNYLTKGRIQEVMAASKAHIGDAPVRARALATEIRQALERRVPGS
jgi:adenylosuccinate lyase